MEELMGNTALVGMVVAALVILGFLFLVTRFLRKVQPGKALIIVSPFSRKKELDVRFKGGVVLPVIHRAEVMDISTKRLTVTRSGKDGLICKDNLRADISVNFYIRVNNTEEDVRSVAQAIGVERASSPETLEELFSAKFSEALKTVGKQMDFEELFKDRNVFKDQIILTIGKNLNGYSLEDTAIDYLEQTPLAALDPNNVMDAEGIRKIIELTLTAKEIKEKRETDANDRILELEKQRAEAEARKESDIAKIQAREEAEAKIVQEEENLRAEQAKIKANEDLEIAEANKERQVEVALKNKEKTIAVEEERVIRERDLEVVERTKLKEIAEFEKERSVETEKKNIADIIRQRVAVERTVAEEEERTKEIRAVAAADRDKKVILTTAEAEAEQNFVLEIKKAEAKERAAKHMAQEKQIQADAELMTAEKISESKKILAQGIVAEEAASGLAGVKVQKAEAEAIKVQGQAKADALEYMAVAEAKALKDKGLAQVEIDKAEAEVIEMKAKAEASETVLKGEAEAKTTQQIADAEASALKAKYLAEAEGKAEIGIAEAKAISEKAEATKLFDGVGREHEEFKLTLEADERLHSKRIDTDATIATEKARTLASALEHANIDIVGGETEFFDKVIGSISTGKAAAGFFRDQNGVLNEVKDHLLGAPSGEAPHLIQKFQTLVKEVKGGSEAVKNLSIAAALVKLAGKADAESVMSEILSLRAEVDKYGIAEKKVEDVIQVRSK